MHYSEIIKCRHVLFCAYYFIYYLINAIKKIQTFELTSKVDKHGNFLFIRIKFSIELAIIKNFLTHLCTSRYVFFYF